jgi:hypothetical protein
VFEAETKALNDKVAEIKARYQPQLDQLIADGEALKDDIEEPGAVGAVINVDIKVDWVNHDFSLDLPSVTMKDQGFSLDLPEVRMDQTHIIFDVPAIRMVDRVIGHKPEFHGPFDIRMTPIIISVPEPYMKRVDISTDVPQFSMKRHDFVIGVPEFRMERQDFSLKIPEFTVINVSAQAAAWEGQGNDLMARGQAIGQSMKAEIDTEVAAFKQRIFGQGSGIKTAVVGAFDTALIQIGNSISTLSQNGCDPIKVPTETGDVNLRKMYDEVSQKKDETLSSVEKIVQPVAAG